MENNRCAGLSTVSVTGVISKKSDEKSGIVYLTLKNDNCRIDVKVESYRAHCLKVGSGASFTGELITYAKKVGEQFVQKAYIDTTLV